MSNEQTSTRRILLGLSGGFLLLGGLFAVERGAPAAASPAAKKFAGATAPVPGTVRISAAQLKSSGGDTSGLDCYACHDEKNPPTVKVSANGKIVFPKEHADLIISMRNCATCHGSTPKLELKYTDDGTLQMPKAHEDLLMMAHGKNDRNDNCFNCHNPSKLNELVTRDGTKLTFNQATLLCATCHGTTYQDWEVGVHGRTNGYWDKSKGDAVRQECTSCHDPHAPAFPKIIPMPAPRAMRPVAAPEHKETSK